MPRGRPFASGRTGLGDDVLLSNTEILKSATRNYSSGAPASHYTIGTRVTIRYATPWRQVAALLEAAARRTPHIAQDPPPFALSEFYVEYRLVAFVPPSGHDDERLSAPTEDLDVAGSRRGRRSCCGPEGRRTAMP